MIQCPLLFTIGSSYDWIHLRVTGMRARLVTSDHAMKAFIYIHMYIHKESQTADQKSKLQTFVVSLKVDITNFCSLKKRTYQDTTKFCSLKDPEYYVHARKADYKLL